MTNPRDITCDTQGHLWSADRCIMCHAPKPRDEPRTSKERVLVSIEEAKRAFVAHYKRAVDDDHDPDHCWIDGYATALRDRATFEPLARSAPDVPHAALARLSQAMGNPAVDWREDTSIEEGLIDEAIRRLTQPPTARPCTHCFSPPELRNPRAGDRCIGCGIDWEDRFSATTQPPSAVRECEWSEIEEGSRVYNTCSSGTEGEFHLHEGLELWPYCMWCGGKVVVTTVTKGTE
jgi:hypothetical protein